MLIVTDGAVDLPDQLADSRDVRIVPGQVTLNDKPVLGADEFWALLRRGTYPSTSPPTMSELVDAYRDPDLVCAIHVSGELSATLAHAQEAAARSQSAVAIIDSRSLSVGSGLIVAAVHQAVHNPAGHESMIGFARSLPDRLHTFALIQDLEALRRSNRSGLLPAGHLARHNHPLLLALRGRVVPLGQSKNRASALKELLTHVRHSVGPRLGAWALGHGDTSDLDWVVDQLGRALGQAPSFVTRIDPTVGAHMGPESVVVGVLSDPITL
jgi:DegV family protein with EDD domain